MGDFVPQFSNLFKCLCILSVVSYFLLASATYVNFHVFDENFWFSLKKINKRPKTIKPSL